MCAADVTVKIRQDNVMLLLYSPTNTEFMYFFITEKGKKISSIKFTLM